MKKTILKSILFFILGIIFLFFGVSLGEFDDALGASLIGIISMLILFYFGIKNFIKTKKA